MSELNAAEVRSKKDHFSTGVRGLDKDEVVGYLGRLALALEVLQSGGPAAELPDDFSPAAIRQREFTTTWVGFNARQVTAYLDQLANCIESLSSPSAQ